MPYGRLPSLSLKESDKMRMKFHLADTDVSMANAIRRTMIAEVPTMAIDLVTVHENTSPLHDEYIVHRMGLVPLHSERIDDFSFAQDCEECDDHCDACSVSFELNVTAPNNSTVVKVTSKDLKLIDLQGNMIDLPTNSGNHAHSVTPVHDSGDVENRHSDRAPVSSEAAILIAKLTRGQKIHMQAIARKGLGKDHAKWSPMCTVAYRIVPPAVELVLDRINAMFSIEQKQELIAASTGLLKVDAKTGELEYEEPFKKGRIGITPDTTRKAGELASMVGSSASEVVRYNPTPERFEFVAETTGAMAPAVALQMALQILQNKIDSLSAHQA